MRSVAKSSLRQPVRWAQIAVALGLLVLLWRAADGPEALRSLAASDWRWLTLAFIALTLQMVLSALRWRLTARQFGIALGRREAVGEYYLSQVVNQSLPGGVLGDAGRAVRSRAQKGLAAAGQAVVFERLAGQIALFATLAAAFVATLAVPGGFDWPRWLAMPVAVFLTAGLCLPGLLALAASVPGAVGRTVRSGGNAFRRAVLSMPALPGQVILSIGTTICNLAAFAFCVRAIGAELGIAATATLVPLILFTMLIPISVSGWGLREGAAATLLPLAGVVASDGLAASVAFGLTVMASSLPGALLLWLKPTARAADRREHGETSPDGTIRRAT